MRRRTLLAMLLAPTPAAAFQLQPASQEVDAAWQRRCAPVSGDPALAVPCPFCGCPVVGAPDHGEAGPLPAP
jgi:hypothetical protein